MIRLEDVPEYSLIRVEKPHNKVYLRDDFGWVNVEKYWDIVFQDDHDGELKDFVIVSLPITHYIEDDEIKSKEV